MSVEPGQERVRRAPLVWTRSFAWGALLVHDAAAELILPDGLGSSSASASATVLAVPVVHAQDRVDPRGWPADLALPPAHVEVYVSFDRTPPGDAVQLECVLDCPSGHLLVGDADEEREIEVARGRVLVQVGLLPDEHADVVVLRVLDGEVGPRTEEPG